MKTFPQDTCRGGRRAYPPSARAGSQQTSRYAKTSMTPTASPGNPTAPSKSSRETRSSSPPGITQAPSFASNGDSPLAAYWCRSCCLRGVRPRAKRVIRGCAPQAKLVMIKAAHALLTPAQPPPREGAGAPRISRMPTRHRSITSAAAAAASHPPTPSESRRHRRRTRPRLTRCLPAPGR
jgi:hypothetical protein